jgi:hypothetical protein
MATPAEIRRRLFLTSQLTALRYGYKFASDCRVHFKNFINDGVERIVQENSTEDEIRLDQAEANILAFTMQMVLEARESGSALLHEPTFFGAKKLICPLWPFC